MKIAIIGYGKMGHEIEAIARDRGHDIPLIIDIENRSDLSSSKMKDIDVAVEFSSPDAAYDNIIACIGAGVPVVSGTTGWLEHWDEVEKLCRENNSGLFYASNFSIGVNILFALNKKLASIMKKFPAYEVSMEEVHHVHKKDAPSGTAITLANQIVEEIPSKDGWSLNSSDPTKVYIESRREGEVPGYHAVSYNSDEDSLTISHDAKSRKGFATGAVLAAEYMAGKTGIHSMNDMLKF